MHACTIASFREVKASDSLRKLVRFHSENKLLLKAYNQKEMRNLGRIVGNQKRKPFAETIGDYEQHFFKALEKPLRCGSNMNVLMNSMGYFSNSMHASKCMHATKSLKETRWVEAIEEKLSVKNVPTKIYGLTREGLSWLLSKIPKTIHPSIVDFSESDSLGLRKTMEEKDISKVEDLKTQNDVYLHLLWEFDVDRIARNNTNLFPLIFEKWDFYREIEVAQHFVSEMPETAFSTLVDYSHKWGDFLEARKHKFSILDLFFLYNLYYAYLKMVTEADHVFLDEKELRQEAMKVFRSKQQLKDLFKILSSQMEERTAESFRFIKNLRLAMSKH